MPDYPFQHICADYFSLNGVSYRVYVDRYSGWQSVIRGTATMDFTKFLARLWENYGCPETLTTDGAANLTAKKVEEFVQAYGIHHRQTHMQTAEQNS